MLFGFDVKLNDKDYIDYNNFVLLKSPYGKKLRITMRILFAFVCIALSLISIINEQSLTAKLVTLILTAIFLIAAEIAFNPLYAFLNKGMIKLLKGKGKMGYTPEATLKFYEDLIIEICPDSKTEIKYTSIERISIVFGKYILFHLNNVLSYILPVSSFKSEEETKAFLAFVKTKFSIIDVYD